MGQLFERNRCYCCEPVLINVDTRLKFISQCRKGVVGDQRDSCPRVHKTAHLCTKKNDKRAVFSNKFARNEIVVADEALRNTSMD